MVEAEERDAIAVQGDVTSQDSMNAAVAPGAEYFGQIDSLVANAGI
jgi:NAD(P)-dependent dehydrogenase (short-subunit alcohol dehydrogenase family)